MTHVITWRSRTWGTLLVVFATFVAVPGCRGKEKPSEVSTVLPELVIRDDTPNMMLTWIDPHGGTHVETSTKSVPEAERRMVRVVISDQEAGTKDPIYVVDLTRGDGGTYRAETISRRQWEEEIERRRSNLDLADLDETERERPAIPRAPNGPVPLPPPELPPSPFGPDPDVPQKPAVPGLVVVVYGAEWCQPCHAALDHLKRRDVKADYKDIDKDSAAREEMRAKLAKIGKPSAAIPVIDVGGQIIVGYSAGALDKALDGLAGGTML